MNIIPHHIITTKTARYFAAGSLTSETKTIWFVLHGFGQLASDFIKEFGYLANTETAVIAPEGLSRSFMGGKIGASWMTKEDRENEIADYVEFLDKVYETVTKELITKPVVNVLGFSQGAHTAIRWFSLGKHNFDDLFICSGDAARDADFAKWKEKQRAAKTYYICGDEDEFVSPKRFEEGKEFYSSNGIEFEAIRFHGKHRVDHDSIKEIISRSK